ncbi:MAG TPA: LssY C-terminal domain-containing protein [Verrucomicrobiae bacterium]|nr:LssY C-terminal domain-containing protein [Verrucomicrobiae bacterium]
MMGTFLRLLWRIFVGVIAAALGYGTVFLFYPYLHNHLPFVINIIILYVLVAYFGIPTLIRLWHFVLKPRHLPLYVTSADGWSSDPVNIAIVCKNQRQLERAMQKAGWFPADKATLKNTLRFAYSMVFKQPYPTAPFSKLYLFGRYQDLGYQIQTGTPPTPWHRHHIRFWQLLPDDPEKPHQHVTFWQNIFKLFAANKRQIWIGAATHDIGPFALRVNSLQVTHQIDKFTDAERDFVISTLEKSKSVARCETIPAGEPVKFRGQTFGVSIVTDGNLQVLELK